MTSPDTSDMVMVPADVVAFLMGESDYDGTWFNELNDGLPGPFWWRSILATARRQSAAAPQAGVSDTGWRDIEALIAACEREYTSDATETEGDPEDGPWRDEDDEPVSHGLAEDGVTIVPGEITFGHIRRARAALPSSPVLQGGGK